jgi:hypothetical protein
MDNTRLFTLPFIDSQSQFDIFRSILANKEKNTLLSQQKITCNYQQQTEHLCKLQFEKKIVGLHVSLFWKKKFTS